MKDTKGKYRIIKNEYGFYIPQAKTFYGWRDLVSLGYNFLDTALDRIKYEKGENVVWEE